MAKSKMYKNINQIYKKGLFFLEFGPEGID